MGVAIPVLERDVISYYIGFVIAMRLQNLYSNAISNLRPPWRRIWIAVLTKVPV